MALLVEKESSAVIFWCAVSPTNCRQTQRDPGDLELLQAVIDHFDLIESESQREEYRLELKRWYECGQKGRNPIRPEYPARYFVAKQELAKLKGEALAEDCFPAFKQQQFELLEATTRADYYQRVAEFLWSRQLIPEDSPSLNEILLSELAELRQSTDITQWLN